MKKFASLLLLALAAQAHAQLSVDDSVTFKIKNVNSGLVLSIPNATQTAGTRLAQSNDDGASDKLWHFIPMGSGQYNIENMATHQVMGVSSGSKANGAL